MKILLSAHSFFPAIGGLETFARLLAEYAFQKGHQIGVVTQTLANSTGNIFPFKVLRQPSIFRLISEIQKADVVVQAQISLKTSWPLLLLRRPWLAIHQVWLGHHKGNMTGLSRLKRWVCSKADLNITASRALASDLHFPCKAIWNCYDNTLYKEETNTERCFDLAFVGRLVSDKGCADLISSLNDLRQGGLKPRLVVVGDGPEMLSLKSQVVSSGLESQVQFQGMCNPEEISRILNRSRILVVPSVWAEPFGIVALEGIACGCAIIASADGGLPEAVGPCGVTFPNSDVNALSSQIRCLLETPALIEKFRSSAMGHLAHFQKKVVFDEYLSAFESIYQFQQNQTTINRRCS